MFKQMLFAACLALPVAAFAADAASTSGDTPSTGHRSKFGACSKEASAKGLKGQDFRNHVSECARGTGTAQPTRQRTAQQGPAAACRKEATGKGLKGAEYKKFVAECSVKA